MKAMLLAAGYGLRMRPLTLLRAKPALPVLNRPLLYWSLRQLARAGVREVAVNLHHLPESVVAALRQARGLGLRVYSSIEREILGTGGGPRAVRDFFGREPFLLVNGDVLFDLDLRRLLRRHRASGALATLCLRANPDPVRYSPVVSDRRGRILAIAGQPLAAARGVVSMFAGIHVVEPRLLERLPEGASDSVRDLYQPLLREGGRLAGVRLPGAWYDLGRPALYREAQLRRLPAGRALVDARARVSPKARVVRSVVGARAELQAGARVTRSVVWEDARVEAGARVEGAILASGAVVARGEHVRGAIVLPAGVLSSAAALDLPHSRHGEMTWVEIR